MANELLLKSFIMEMKKHPDFRSGWHDGKEHGLKSRYLVHSDVSNYRQKFGALVACWEQGLVTDVALDRHKRTVTAFNGTVKVYFYQG